MCAQVGASVDIVEADGEVVTVSCLEGTPRNVFERWDDTNWRLGQALRQVMQQLAAAARGGSGSSSRETASR